VTGVAWADVPLRASAESQIQPVLKSIPGRNVLAGANSIGGFVMKKVAFVFTLILAVAIQTGPVIAMDLAQVDSLELACDGCGCSAKKADAKECTCGKDCKCGKGCKDGAECKCGGDCKCKKGKGCSCGKDCKGKGECGCGKK